MVQVSFGNLYATTAIFLKYVIFIIRKLMNALYRHFIILKENIFGCVIRLVFKICVLSRIYIIDKRLIITILLVIQFWMIQVVMNEYLGNNDMLMYQKMSCW